MRFVPSKALQSGMVLGRDILSTKNAHMLRKGVTLTDDYVKYINENGYAGAYILDSLSEDIEIDETVSLEIFEKAIDSVNNNNIGEMINAATAITKEISESDNIVVDLLDLRSYDDYTYHHSVNVAVYASIIGKKLGLGVEDIEMLCQAAITHDLGKSKISLDILNKPGRLTDEEFELIKCHPKYSYDILSEKNEVPAKVKQAVYMHHENENGSGYPFGREGDEIPLFAKIIHATDVYDALTSRRPYKQPYSPVAAFEYLEGGEGILFDKRVVEAIISTIPAYPPGITVTLSNGQTAVVAAHTEDALRPKVKLIETGEAVNLFTDRRYENVKIVSSEIMEQDYSEEIEALNEARMAVKELKKTIMIVDDMKLSLEQTKQAIKGNYEFATFKSGLEAINNIKKNGAPDLLILDIEMPIMNGIQVAETLRKMGFNDLPIMFLTANNSRETVLAGQKVNAIDYILKPAKPMYISKRVEMALENKVLN